MEEKQLQTVKVFVYGTLKKGESRAPVLQREAIKWVPAAILGFKLYDLGSFPCIGHSENGDQVFGELVECTNPDAIVERLDMIEGYTPEGKHNLYNREEVDVIELGNGRKSKAFVYVFARGTDDFPQVKSGNWTRGENW